jgi:hypothetical protein
MAIIEGSGNESVARGVSGTTVPEEELPQTQPVPPPVEQTPEQQMDAKKPPVEEEEPAQEPLGEEEMSEPQAQMNAPVTQNKKTPMEQAVSDEADAEETPKLSDMYGKYSLDPEDPAKEAEKQNKAHEAQVEQFSLSKDAQIKEIDGHIEKINGYFDMAYKPDPNKPETAPVKEEGFFALNGLTRALESTRLGLMKATEDMANGVKILANAGEDMFADMGLGDGQWLDESKIEFPGVNNHPNTEADRLVYMAARYLAPMGAIGAASKWLGSLGKLGVAGSALSKYSGVVGASAEAALQGLVYDPDDGKLSDMCVKNSWMIAPMCQVLAQEDDDSPFEARVKAGAESLVMAGFGKAVFEGGKYVLKSEKVAGFISAVGNHLKNKEKYKLTEKASEIVKEIMTDPKVQNAIGKTDDASKAIIKEAQTKIDSVSAVNKVKNAVPISKADEKLIAEMNDFRTDKMLDPNTQKNFSSAKTARAVIEALKTHENPLYKAAYEEMKRGKVKLSKTYNQALEIVKDEKKLQGILNRKKGVPLNAEEYVAVTMLSEGARVRAQELAKVPVGKMSEAHKIAFMEALDEVDYYHKSASAGLSEAMRTGRSAREAWKAADTPYKKLQHIKNYVKLAGPDLENRIRYAQAALKEGQSIPTIVEKTKTAAPGLGTKISNRMYGLFVNGVCAKINTFLFTNMGSNIANIYGQDSLELFFESLQKDGPDFLRVQKAKQAGWRASFIESARAARKIVQTGEVPAELAGKLELPENFFSEAGDGVLGEYGSLANKAVATPGRVMSGGDAMAKIQVTRGKINSYAAMMVDQMEGLSAAQKQIEYDRIRMNPPDAFELSALNEAKELTYTRKIEELSYFPRKVGEGLTSLSEALPGGKILLPFIGIGANQADAILMRTPLATLQPEFWGAIRQGGAAARKAKARVYSGMALMTLGGVLYETGFIKEPQLLPGSEENAVSNTPTREGFTNTALGAVKTAVFGIPGAMIMIGADATRVLHHLIADDIPDMIAYTTHAALEIAKKFEPEALHGALADTVSLVEDIHAGRVSEEKLASRIGRFVESVTPGRWTYINTLDNLDPIKRDVGPSDPDAESFIKDLRSSLLNNYKEKFGLGGGVEALGIESLPRITNIFGETVEPPPGIMHDMRSAFFGGDTKDPQADSVKKWIKGLGLNAPRLDGVTSQEAIDLHVTMPRRTLTRSMGPGVSAKVQLNPKQYRQLIEHVNEPLNGKTLIQELDAIRTNPNLGPANQKIRIKELLERRKTRANQIMLQKTETIKDKMMSRLHEREQLLKADRNEFE